MNKLFAALCALACLSVATLVQAADPFPEALLQKVEELKTMAHVEKKELPKKLEGVPVISATDAQKLWKAKKAVFLDTRVKNQYDTEKIPGAEWFLTDDLMNNPDLSNQLDKNKEYVLYCNGVLCWRSPGAALLLKHQGFNKIHWLREGLPEWKAKGFKTE
jgi:rhodanese-related sulfurtransferase